MKLLYLYQFTILVKYVPAVLGMYMYDTGYPHDGRADNAAYPHDSRADNAAYPHDRHI